MLQRAVVTVERQLDGALLAEQAGTGEAVRAVSTFERLQIESGALLCRDHVITGLESTPRLVRRAVDRDRFALTGEDWRSARQLQS